MKRLLTTLAVAAITGLGVSCQSTRESAIKSEPTIPADATRPANAQANHKPEAFGFTGETGTTNPKVTMFEIDGEKPVTVSEGLAPNDVIKAEDEADAEGGPTYRTACPRRGYPFCCKQRVDCQGFGLAFVACTQWGSQENRDVFCEDASVQGRRGSVPAVLCTGVSSNGRGTQLLYACDGSQYQGPIRYAYGQGGNNPEPVTCQFGGRTYQAGESFDAGDNCNTCNCQADGQVACTERACEGGGGARFQWSCAQRLACPRGYRFSSVSCNTDSTNQTAQCEDIESNGVPGVYCGNDTFFIRSYCDGSKQKNY